MLCAHYFACLWWYVGQQAYRLGIPATTNDDGVTTYSSWIQSKGIDLATVSFFEKYSMSWYWAVVTFATTG